MLCKGFCKCSLVAKVSARNYNFFTSFQAVFNVGIRTQVIRKRVNDDRQADDQVQAIEKRRFVDFDFDRRDAVAVGLDVSEVADVTRF